MNVLNICLLFSNIFIQFDIFYTFQGHSNQSSTTPIGNGNYETSSETDVLLKLNKKIKKVEREVEELRKSISVLSKK